MHTAFDEALRSNAVSRAQLAVALALGLALAGCSTNTSGPDAGDSGVTPRPDAGDGGSGPGPDAGDAGFAICSDGGPDCGQPQVARSIALSADGTSLWVVNTESDSISQINVASRSVQREILLAAQPMARDPVTLRYDPAVRPRSLALIDSLDKVYVAGQSANQILVVNTQSGLVTAHIPVGAEPVSVVATADGTTVYAVSHEAAVVSKIDTATDTVTAVLPVNGVHPWGASLRADGSLLYVTQFLLQPALTVIDTSTFTVSTVTALPDQPVDPSGVQFVPSGQVRGVYAAVPRPNTGEIWLPHMLLGTGNSQTGNPFILDFESTAWATFTILTAGGTGWDNRLTFDFESLQGSFPNLTNAVGAFIDVISGPRDIAFTPDGTLALVADAQSEDVMVFDANLQAEVGLVRPTFSALTEGIVIDPAGAHAYLQGRNTHNITVIDITEGVDGGLPDVVVDGDGGIECLANGDPMAPPLPDGGVGDLRHGQRLFYTSNSSLYPVTQNFWIACSTCHLEGQSDAVTWEFAQGPRDTPSNAGGPINTGFLFRQAVRNNVIDYDQTIRTEQGGFYHRNDPAQLPDLEALADFTNYAIPFPQNPNLSPDGGLTTTQALGQALFYQPTALLPPLPDGGLAPRCAYCHAGPYYTDSGDGNPGLVLGPVVTSLSPTAPEFPVLLHDMTHFTCETDGGYPDQSSTDIDGGYRSPCEFDTPTLRSVFASAPYLHDGSAQTIAAAIYEMPDVSDLSATDISNLEAFVQTL